MRCRWSRLHQDLQGAAFGVLSSAGSCGLSVHMSRRPKLCRQAGLVVPADVDEGWLDSESPWGPVPDLNDERVQSLCEDCTSLLLREHGD
jgi:hypothetical protein